ncbi:MAG: PEGA domain-containing protein [Kofleriaceae bacterium]
MIAVAVGGALARPAVADELPVPDDPPAEAPIDPALEANRAEARRRFEQGVALAQAGNCDAAIAELRASYELVPRPNTLYNIGQCNETLGRYADAVATYEEFLAVAPADDPDRRLVEAQIASLRRLLGRIVLRTNVEAEVWLGDRLLGQAPGELLIEGGRHTIELRREGYDPIRREVDLAGGRVVELDLELRKLAPKIIRQNTVVERKAEGLPRYLFWSGVGATSAALLVGTGFGVHALLGQRDAEAIDPRLPRDDERDSIERSAKIADIGFLAAGVFAVGTTVVYFLTDWGGPAEQPTLAPTPVPGGAALSLTGAW